jgi:hypothetical protein
MKEIRKQKRKEGKNRKRPRETFPAQNRSQPAAHPGIPNWYAVSLFPSVTAGPTSQVSSSSSKISAVTEPARVNPSPLQFLIIPFQIKHPDVPIRCAPSSSLPSLLFPPQSAARSSQFITGELQHCHRASSIPMPLGDPATSFWSPYLPHALAHSPDMN